jgi:hypothetical protein
MRVAKGATEAEREQHAPQPSPPQTRLFLLVLAANEHAVAVEGQRGSVF